jgi:hypothetical protein
MGPIAGETPAPDQTPTTGQGDEKMSFTGKIASITTAAALAATALGPLATSASAEGWRDGRRGGPDYAYSERHNWKGGHRKHRRYGHHRRHHKRDNTGKYIALGVGALMLGIIASEAARH